MEKRLVYWFVIIGFVANIGAISWHENGTKTDRLLTDVENELLGNYDVLYVSRGGPLVNEETSGKSLESRLVVIENATGTTERDHTKTQEDEKHIHRSNVVSLKRIVFGQPEKEQEKQKRSVSESDVTGKLEEWFRGLKIPRHSRIRLQKRSVSESDDATRISLQRRSVSESDDAGESLEDSETDEWHRRRKIPRNSRISLQKRSV